MSVFCFYILYLKEYLWSIFFSQSIWNYLSATFCFYSIALDKSEVDTYFFLLEFWFNVSFFNHCIMNCNTKTHKTGDKHLCISHSDQDRAFQHSPLSSLDMNKSNFSWSAHLLLPLAFPDLVRVIIFNTFQYYLSLSNLYLYLSIYHLSICYIYFVYIFY
jgi:hypothetical protein